MQSPRLPSLLAWEGQYLDEYPLPAIANYSANRGQEALIANSKSYPYYVTFSPVVVLEEAGEEACQVPSSAQEAIRCVTHLSLLTNLECCL